MDRQPAIVLANGLLRTVNAKTTHALLRSSARYEVLAVIDGEDSGRDAGECLDGLHRDIPVLATVPAAMARFDGARRPRVCVVGVATGGGVLPPSLRTDIEAALRAGLTVVNGLHQFLSADPALVALADAHGGALVDIRCPPPPSQLRFWDGSIDRVKALRVPVLGTDCAIGKRTTALMLRDACRRSGLSAEMVYTGQTGWLQGMTHGFILDSTPNDFVSGQLEGAVVDCWDACQPDVILIEGQSSLRNPSGPCGTELIVSTFANGVVLQHAPGRETYLDNELRTPIRAVEEEIAIIQHFDVSVWAVTLNTENISVERARAYGERLRSFLQRPVVLPLEDGLDEVVAVIQRRGRRPD